MKQTNNKGFTLVELIVVITILAILGTIAFISLQGYSKTARDSKRISDVNNIKTSLELFILNAGKYPLPDDGEEVAYSGETLWTQGVVGNIVSTNLSRNLNKKPIDPLTELEYTYSVINSQTKYELLSIYESDLVSYNNLLNQTYTANTNYPKINGNYNGVFVKTKNYYIPIPSIITSETPPFDFQVEPLKIQSQIVTGGENNIAYGTNEAKINGLPNFTLQAFSGTIDTTTGEDDNGAKEDLANKLILAYSGTLLANEGIYKQIVETNGTDDLISLIDNVVLSSIPTSNSSGTPPINGTCGTASKEYLYSDISYGIDIYCGDGSVTGGGTPIFPIEGGNTTWTCDGLNGGDVSAQCEATRTNTPFPSTCGNGEIITYQQAQDNKATILANINNYIGCGINDYPGTSIPGSGVYIAGLTNSNADIMVVAKSDISGTKQWGCNGTTTSATSITDGIANTTQFLNICSESDRAPKLCRNIGTNWYLPAGNELNTIYDNKSNLGTFANLTYWSSSEISADIARIYYFNLGYQSSIDKNDSHYVRCSSRF